MIKLLTLNLAKYIPFLLKSIRYKPQSITISLTNRCNCRCIMCNYWKFIPEDELNANEIKDILNQAKKAGVNSCVLYGGEPLLRDDVFEIISYAHKLGMTTRIITNGILLDRNIAGELKQSGISEITLSVDAISSLIDEIRGKNGACNKILSALDELIRLREESNIKITIAAILMRPTLENDNLLKVIKLAEELHISVIIQLLDFNLFYFKDVEEKIKKQLWIGEEQKEKLGILIEKLIKIKKETDWLIENSTTSLRYIKKYFKDSKSQNIPCYIAFGGRIWVDSVGKVYLCQGLPFAGDLRENKLKDIIYSKKWRIGVYNMFKKQCPGCSCMYSSSVDAHLPLLFNSFIKDHIKNE